MNEDLFGYNNNHKWSIDIVANGCYAFCGNLTADDIDKIIAYAKSLESED